MKYVPCQTMQLKMRSVRLQLIAKTGFFLTHFLTAYNFDNGILKKEEKYAKIANKIGNIVTMLTT